MNKTQGEMSRGLISKRKKKEGMCKHRREWKVKEYKMIKNAQVLSKSIEKGVKKSHTSPAAGKVKIEKEKHLWQCKDMRGEVCNKGVPKK